MWQVVEMIESISPEQFSVSVVAVKWIREIDGELFCLWPETNPTRKIKLALEPKAGEKWQLYKCRILMDGVKYNSYVEAREAERKCANETMTIKRENDDDIVDEMEGETKKIKLDFAYNHFAPLVLKKHTENDDESEVEYFSGNDSFDFNKAMVKGGPYCHYNFGDSDDETSRFINVEHLDSTENKTSTSLKYRQYLENSQNFLSDESDCDDYNDFKSDVDKRLTSTVVSHTSSTSQDYKKLRTANNEPNNKADSQNEILLRIRNLECLLSEFTSNVLRELHELKEMVTDCDASKIKGLPVVVEEDREKIEILNVEVVKLPDDMKSICPKQNYVSLANISIGEEEHFPPAIFELSTKMLRNTPIEEPMNVNIVSYLQDANDATFAIPYANVKTDKPELQLPVVDQGLELPGDYLQDANDVTFAIPDANVKIDKPELQLPVVEQGLELPGDNPDECSPELPFLEKSVRFGGISLPIGDIPDHDKFERSLLSVANANVLKEITLPMENEIETKYMDRIFLKLFKKDYFLDCICWKKEENRVDLRGGMLLKCWQESYKSKYGKNVTVSQFQTHCRR